MGNRVFDTAADTAKGSIALFVGNSIALVASAIGTIYVARMLTPSEYGIYILTLVLPNILNLLTLLGINQGLTRFIARQRSRGGNINIRNMLKAGYLFNFILSGSLSLVLFFSSDFLSTIIMNKPELGNYVRIASMVILTQTMYDTGLAVLAGFEKMMQRASVNIIQSGVKTVISSILVFLGYGITGVLFGHIFSFVIAALVGILFVLNNVQKINIEYEMSMRRGLKHLLGFGFPLFIGNLIAGVDNQFRGLLLAWYVSEELVGNYGIALWFQALLGLTSRSLGITLLPAFSKFNVEKEPEMTRNLFQGTVRYSSLFLIPTTFLLIAVSRPLIYTLFGNKYPYTPTYIIFLIIPVILTGFGAISILRFLNSQGETRSTMIVIILSSSISVILSFIFTIYWGIEGLLFGIFIIASLRTLISREIILKKYNIKLRTNHSIRVIISALFSAGGSIAIQQILSTANSLFVTLVSGVVFVVLFLLLSPLFKALEIRDITNLDMMMKKLGRIYPLIKYILKFEERLIIFFESRDIPT